MPTISDACFASAATSARERPAAAAAPATYFILFFSQVGKNNYNEFVGSIYVLLLKLQASIVLRI